MKPVRCGSLLLASALACALGVGGPALGAGEDRDETIQSGGVQRMYHVHLPPTAPAGARLPLVLVFHGGGGTAKGAARQYGFNQLADARGFVVVYPDGVDRRWNDGRGTTGQPWLNTVLVDDVGFVSATIDRLRNALPIDARRVYATGMSNGAIMAYRLASELSDRIAAIAPVSGPMGTEKCSPRRPVPVLHFHGTNDEFAPFKGGKGEKSLSGTDFYSVEHSIQAWVRANGCKAEPATVELPDKAKDGTRVTRKTYGGGKDGAEVVLVVIEGGGHTWPGREPALKLLGKATKNVSANELMWEFFQKHPMK
jgi:polyhydroxybutyrate depolymerase